MKKSTVALFLCGLAAVLALSASAADEFTLYELQPPETHQFAITYDVTATRELHQQSLAQAVVCGGDEQNVHAAFLWFARAGRPGWLMIAW